MQTYGDCSQSCRWQYNIELTEKNNPESKLNVDFDERGTYIFSSKDLCLIDEIPTILNLGIDSLKIEGRLKTDYYLATIVRNYRLAIDEAYNLTKQGKIEEYNSIKYIEDVSKVKTRGLSKFYFNDSNNQDIHDLDGQSENVLYEYAGKIKQAHDNNIYTIEIKNKLNVGDILDVLFIDTIEINEFTITKLYDTDNKKEIDTINPGKKGQLVNIYIPYKLEENIVLRRKKQIS